MENLLSISDNLAEDKKQFVSEIKVFVSENRLFSYRRLSKRVSEKTELETGLIYIMDVHVSCCQFSNFSFDHLIVEKYD